MQIIAYTIAGAVILIWGAILAMIRWLDSIQHKHLLGFGGYVTVVAGALIFLVLSTSKAEQDAAEQKTRERLDQTVEYVRQKMDQQSEKLFGQIAEKAELTQSEWEVRGNLQTERAEHAQTREQLLETETELLREATSHRAYRDSLKVERAQHADARLRLQREVKKLNSTAADLEKTRANLATSSERVRGHESDLKRIRKLLANADQRLKESLSNTAVANKDLARRMTFHEDALTTLQSSVDSIYRKVLKRQRIPVPEEK